MTTTVHSFPRRLRRGAASLASSLVLAMLVGACGAETDVAVPDAAKMRGESQHTPSPTPSETPTEPETAEPEPTPTPEAAPLEGPYTVRIPRIDVAAPVVPIEVNADRVLVPPRELTIVGWWSQGAAPGAERGSAVLVGHSARAGGGIFDDVGDLEAGDTIEVAGESDSLTYEVESIEVLSKEDLARNAEEIFDQGVPGRLVVITCEDFDGQEWRSNIVTIATPA
jgi:LPXTG-site transpeptidase (sortase) family protein